MLPRYIVVKGIRCMVHILIKCSYGPFMIPKLPMKVTDPQVKLRANFCGLNASVGTPTKKARAKKRADRNNSAQNTLKRCWYPIPKIFFGICASIDCFMLSIENPGRFSELNKGKTCSLSMENQLELDEASPFSDAFCSSYQLPKEDVDDGIVVTDLRLLMIELVSNEYYGLVSSSFFCDRRVVAWSI